MIAVAHGGTRDDRDLTRQQVRPDVVCSRHSDHNEFRKKDKAETALTGISSLRSQLNLLTNENPRTSAKFKRLNHKRSRVGKE